MTKMFICHINIVTNWAVCWLFILNNLLQDSEPDIVNGVGTEAGHVIRTTIGGRNGQAKQVI